MSAIIIVGGGQAAGQAVARIRQNGYAGKLTLIGDEPHAPYQRPPLSKQYLAGEMGIDRVLLRPTQFYADKQVELRLGERVESIDPGAKTVILAGGDQLGYNKLLLATGGRARRLPLPGSEHASVHYLRSIQDVDRIRARMVEGANLVIIGGGYIGLEVASVATRLGVKVTVLEMEPRVLARVTSERMSAYYEHLHTSRGVQIVTNARATSLADLGERVKVCCADGRGFDADLVIIGAGIVPEIALAEQAGLACSNGIIVDERCRTSDPDIHAAGDCTNHPNPLLKRRLRLESVPNAMEQARVCADNMCDKPASYAAIPWFWSDQYELKLQMAGFSAGADEEVQRGDPADNAFSVLYLESGSIIAVESVNNPREFMAARKLIENATPVRVQELMNSQLPLQTFI